MGRFAPTVLLVCMTLLSVCASERSGRMLRQQVPRSAAVATSSTVVGTTLSCLTPTAGARAMKEAGDIFSSIFGKIPKVGGILNGIGGLFWPAPEKLELTAECIWDSIKGYVEVFVDQYVIKIYDHVNQVILQERLRNVDLKLRALAPTVNSYIASEGDLTLHGQKWGFLDGAINNLRQYVFDETLAPAALIPYQMAYGSFSLAWLWDEVYQYPVQHFGIPNPNPNATYANFKDNIVFFGQMVATARLKIVDSVLEQLFPVERVDFPSGYRGDPGFYRLHSAVPGYEFNFGIPFNTDDSCNWQSGSPNQCWDHNGQSPQVWDHTKWANVPLSMEAARKTADYYQKTFKASLYQWRKLKYAVLTNPATAWPTMDNSSYKAVVVEHTQQMFFAGGAGSVPVVGTRLTPTPDPHGPQEGGAMVWNISRITLGGTGWSSGLSYPSPKYPGVSYQYPPHDPMVHFIQLSWRRADGTGEEDKGPLSGRDGVQPFPDLVPTVTLTLDLVPGEYVTYIKGQISAKYMNYLFMSTNLGRNVSAGEGIYYVHDNSFFEYEWAHEAGLVQLQAIVVEAGLYRNGNDAEGHGQNDYGFVCNLDFTFNVDLLKLVDRPKPPGWLGESSPPRHASKPPPKAARAPPCKTKTKKKSG